MLKSELEFGVVMKRLLLRFPVLAVALLLCSDPPNAAAKVRLGSIDRSFRIEMLDEGIYFGSAPQTDSDFARLRQLGVRHVIDTRTIKVLASAKEARRASGFGMVYERLPTSFFPTKRGDVPSIMSRLYRKPCGTIFFHCNLGSDRTGLIAALYRVNAMGWDPHAAFAEWKSDQFNTRLKDLDRYYWQHIRPRNQGVELQESSHRFDVTPLQQQPSSLRGRGVGTNFQEQSPVDPSRI